MEFQTDVTYERILKMIQQLPVDKIVQLKSELTDNFIKKKVEDDLKDFQEFLLNGPVMTDEQYEGFLENRKQFNQWRTE